jgi:myo-inositol-1(or 4)-monophosphatase
MTAEYTDFIDETLRLCGVELASRFGRNNNPREKQDFSIVTDADLASEKVILDRIAKYFPNDAIISEEAGFLKVNRTPGHYVWIVDPLDGTTNFANGFPFFCISIARAKFLPDGTMQSVQGGIRDPLHDKTFIATFGGGATCNGQSIQVKASRPLDKTFLVTGFYYTKGFALDKEIQRFQNVAQSCQSIRRTGSSALDLAYVAAGIYDAFWERGLAVWDVAAGSLLVQEAGGSVRNYPQEKSASLVSSSSKLSYNIEGDGVVAGSTSVVSDIVSLF